MIKSLFVELRRYCMQFKRHFIQYTLMFMALLLLCSLGVYFKIEGYNINNYERLTYFTLIYYLIILRIVSNGIATPYGEIFKEEYENKVLYNITISIKSQKQILCSRFLISSVANMLMTIVLAISFIIMTGVQYSIINYMYLMIIYLVALWFVYGIGIIYACICKIIKLEKIVAMFFQVVLIVIFVIASGGSFYNIFGYYKDEIYYILYSEIITATTYNCDWHKVLVLLVSGIMSIFFAGIIYEYTSYKNISKVRKKYE